MNALGRPIHAGRACERDRAAHGGATHRATGTHRPYMRTITQPMPDAMHRPIALRYSIASLALLGLIAACSGDDDVDARREAAREQVHERRISVRPRDEGATVRETALSGAYRNAILVGVEEVAAAIAAIPIQARRIRTAKAIGDLSLRLAPEPIVIGPSARGDLQIDNTAPLETIRNAIEGSALAYARVRREGVVIADIVAATLEGDALTVYLAAE